MPRRLLPNLDALGTTRHLAVDVATTTRLGCKHFPLAQRSGSHI
jgi:hypothetical protein